MTRLFKLATVFALVFCFTGSALAAIENPSGVYNQETQMHGAGSGDLNPLIDNPAEGYGQETEMHGPGSGDLSPIIFGWLWVLLV